MERMDSPSAEAGLWAEIKDVFDLFDVHDMSSDETETEAQFSAAKTVRRIRRCWINDEVSKVRGSLGLLHRYQLLIEFRFYNLWISNTRVEKAVAR
jgi:hypothetical protein